MLCGTCKEPMESIAAWKKHLADTGCDWGREVWKKHLAARDRGRPGRRYLSQAWPRLWKPERMTEEAKERLREIGEKRIHPRKTRRPIPKPIQKRRRRKA